MRECKDCLHYTEGGVPEARREIFGPDGICDLYFPRGYVARKPPHFVRGMQNACFQFEQREEEPEIPGQMSIGEFLTEGGGEE